MSTAKPPSVTPIDAAVESDDSWSDVTSDAEDMDTYQKFFKYGPRIVDGKVIVPLFYIPIDFVNPKRFNKYEYV